MDQLFAAALGMALACALTGVLHLACLIYRACVLSPDWIRQRREERQWREWVKANERAAKETRP